MIFNTNSLIYNTHKRFPRYLLMEKFMVVEKAKRAIFLIFNFLLPSYCKLDYTINLFNSLEFQKYNRSFLENKMYMKLKHSYSSMKNIPC